MSPSELPFADDAGSRPTQKEALQRLIDRFDDACSVFGPTISLKKTQAMGQGVGSAPSITIDDYTLVVVDKFTYLESTSPPTFP
jgi:hypothetical protein